MSSRSAVNHNVQQGSVGSHGATRQDSEDEYEEEEHLVSVELTGIIDSDILEKCNNRCKILGINTEKPFLQVDKYVFAGEYEDTLGTCVIFEEPPEQGGGENAKPKLKYKCHTVKKLNMTRTFLTEKKEGDDGGGKIEWFQIKEDSNASWPHSICSFAHENEEPDESVSEQEEDECHHEQLDESTEDVTHAEQSLNPGSKQSPDSEEKANSSMETSDPEGKVREERHTDTSHGDGDTDKSSCTAEQE